MATKSFVCKPGKRFPLLLFVFFSHMAFSQITTISTQNIVKGMPLMDIIKEIESQSGFSFVYNPEHLKDLQLSVSPDNNMPLQNLLKMILEPLGLGFILYRNKIILKKNPDFIPMTKLKVANQVEAMQKILVRKILVGRILGRENGLPIADASIRIKGGNHKGTASDEDGYYKLHCFVGDTILISAIGFKQKEEVVGLKILNDIPLETDIINLKEINIIGYGEEGKEEKTGAVSSISPFALGEIPNHPDEILAGSVSGLWFQKTSGVPGASSTISIRGLTSLQPDANSPLIVVDGVPLFSLDENLNHLTSLSAGENMLGLMDNYVVNDVPETDLFQKNGMNMINPEDIQSVSVLKDAYSTSIYGSRGATGVILITTKQPKTLGLNINFLTETGIAKPIGKPNLMNGEEYANFYSNYYSKLLNEEISFPNNINTNWYDKVVRTAKHNKYAFSIQNKQNRGSLFFSFSHLELESYILGADLKRYTGRLNVQQNVKHDFQLGSNFSISSEKNNAILAPKIYRNAILKAPNVPIYAKNGDFNFENGENPFGNYLGNPLAMALEGKGEILDHCIISNTYAKIKLSNWLTYQLDFAFHWIETDAVSQNRKSNEPDKKQSVESNGNFGKWLITNTIRGVQCRKNHSLRFVLGQSYEKASLKQEEMIYEQSSNLNQGLNLSDFQPNRKKYALASWFGRINYRYKNYFFAGISYRIDGSSRFSENNKYQIFPAFSMGYNVIENRANQFANHIKLRASFGYSGVEQSTRTYGALRSFEAHQHDLTYGNKPILTEVNASNLKLSWEKTRNLDFGIDFSLLNKNLSGSIDYYSKKSNNLLLYTDVPAIWGYRKQWINAGSMKNTGLEINLEANIIKKALNWNLDFIAAYNKNKLLEINEAGYEIWSQEQAYKYFEEGSEAAQFYLFEWMGVNPQNGNPLWKYADGNIGEKPPSDPKDRKKFGSGIPKFTGALRNILAYKGIELSCYFVFSEGKKLMNGTSAILHTYTTPAANNLSKSAANYWKNSKTKAHNPALFNSSVTRQQNYITSRTSSRFYEDASFIRLKNMVLAYRFPKKINKHLGVKQMKIYVQASNLFTISNYSGTDPEVSAFGSSSLLSGYDEVNMPQVKSFSFGVRIGI